MQKNMNLEYICSILLPEATNMLQMLIEEFILYAFFKSTCICSLMAASCCKNQQICYKSLWKNLYYIKVQNKYAFAAVLIDLAIRSN